MPETLLSVMLILSTKKKKKKTEVNIVFQYADKDILTDEMMRKSKVENLTGRDDLIRERDLEDLSSHIRLQLHNMKDSETTDKVQ